MRLAGRDIVCVGPTDWEGVWARPQQLMSRLAGRGNRVLYVNPPVTLAAPLKSPALAWRLARSGRRPRPVAEGIWILDPPPFLPLGNRYRFINRCNQVTFAAALRRALDRLSFADPVLWTYLPGTADLAPMVPHAVLCYDCVDDHAAFPGLIDPGVVERMEADLLRQAGVVLASADRLWRKCAAVRPGALLVPNAADVDHFARARAGLPEPADLASLPRPRLGFVGGIGAWVDLDLIALAASSHPEWSVVLVGPLLTDAGRLRGLPNVHLLGPRPYRDLPAYLAAFDLCLNPFRVNRLTASVNPIKVYEYLAAGREVVSTALPELDALRGVIHLAADGADFVRLAELVLAGRAGYPEEARLAAARTNSWEERLARIDAAFATLAG